MKFFLTAILLFAVNCYAQTPETVIKNLREKFNTIQDFKSSFKQTTNGSFNESGLSLPGNFSYQKKNKFKVGLKNVELISDGKTIWNYDKRLNRVVINKSDESNAFLNLDDIINNYPEQCSAELVKETGSDKFYVLKLTPKRNTLEFEYANIWIDKNYILNKIIFKD
ncbi:MAG: outer membrane lipoprotein carrier protein LolA, partial [Melioribacteraceae bacterium]